MRGTPLGQLRYLLRAEVGQSVIAGTSSDMDAIHNALLWNAVCWLAAEADWPWMEHRWDVPLVTGTRYYSLPTTTSAGGDSAQDYTINLTRPIRRVEVYYNSAWQDLKYGVDSEEYDWLNSDGVNLDGSNPQTEDPVQRWRFASNVDDPTNPNQFEVWPVPAGAAQTIRFTGQRDPLPFATWENGIPRWDDQAPCDFDDQLVILPVAAELLLRSEAPDAQAKGTRMLQRLTRMKNTSYQRDGDYVLGKNLYQKGPLRRVVPIVIAPTRH